MRHRASIGGRANVQGVDYEQRVAAWAFAGMMGGAALHRFNLPDHCRASAIWMQAPVAAGDVVIEHSGGGAVYIQAKFRKEPVSFATASNDVLAEVFHQFAQIFLSQGDAGDMPNRNPWLRAFDPNVDRLALVLPSSAGQAMGHGLLDLLNRLQQPDGWRGVPDRFNAEEQVRIGILRAVAEKSLREAGGSPDAVELFLSVVCVVVLDLDDAATNANEARTTLETSVLTGSSSKRGDDAWRALMTVAAETNRFGSRVQVSDLSKKLQSIGIELRPAATFRASIKRLQDITRKNLKRLSRYGQLRPDPNGVVEIERNCVAALINGTDQHRVVVGRPGAGKSGVLSQACTLLLAARRDLVLLLADDLQASSDRPLREALQLEADLPDVLAAWFGSGPGLLVIDALDAARDAKVAHNLRAAMASIIADENRWRILASVRRFDLKHSPETRDLFPGSAVTGYRDSDFSEIAHFAVPELSDEELVLAGRQNAGLRTLLGVARRYPVTFSLLKQPFNLSLACELLRAQVPVGEIVPFETNTVLLDRYWLARVTDHPVRGAPREAVLASIVDRLVARLAMRVPDERNLNDRQVMTELLEANILDSGAAEDGEIRFSHHLLHDYAVSRLLFRRLNATQLIDKIVARPELSLYARQSLLLHFDQLWDREASRETFWATACALLGAENIPLVARILTTECAIANVSRFDDFVPLLQWIATEDANAIRLLQFCVGGFLDVDIGDQFERVADAWVELAVHLGEKAPGCFWQTHLLLFKLVPGREKPSQRLLAPASRAARALLKGLPPEETNGRFGPAFLTALRVICQTSEAARIESEAALRPYLSTEFAQKHGDRVYWQLADTVKDLIPVLPEFVRDFYVVVFGTRFTEEGWESLGRSKIMPMQIQRRDNYNMARHKLDADFESFFATNPLVATQAVLRLMPGFRDNEHPRSRSEKDEPTPFRFRGRECTLIGDMSAVWASDSSAREEDGVSVLRKAARGWSGLAEAGRDKETGQILDVIAAEAKLAVIWMHLLNAGCRSPDTLGRQISPLLQQEAILLGYDTHHPAAKLLKILFKGLDKAERRSIEQAIVKLPPQRWRNPDGKIEERDSWRGLFLNQLEPHLMETDEAKEVRERLKAANALRKNEPPVRSWGGTGSTDWKDYHPELEKVDLKSPVHLQAREWEQKLRSFARTDGKPYTPELIEGIWPTLVSAFKFAVQEPPPELDFGVARIVWQQVVATSEIIARSRAMPTEVSKRDFLRGLLLRAVDDPDPAVRDDTEKEFARSPGWGSPSPRIDAAEALIVWGRETKTMEDGIRHALRKLARDPHPAVRFQILSGCNALYEADRPLMWELIKTAIKQETNAGVWGGLLAAVERIAPGHHDEAAGIYFDYLKRFPATDEARRDPAEVAVGGLSSLFVRYGHAAATRYIMELVQDPVRNSHHLSQLSHGFRDTLNIGVGPGATPFQRGLHERGCLFFLRVAKNARAALEAFIASADRGIIPPGDEFRAVLQLLDTVNMQVFFASGAHDRGNSSKDHATPLAPADFWRENKPIIDELVALPSSRIAYHLAETLEHLIPADPAAIFRCLVMIVANAKRDGFAHEHLAVGVISRIVERYLADYASLFAEQRELLNGLLQILDTFADVGWPEARRLIRNLSGIYR